MNGKVVFRQDFYNCLNYVLGKEKSERLDSNMIGQTPTQLATEFNLIASRSDRIQKPAMHLSLSPHPDDILSNHQKRDFSKRLLNLIGMENCQWVLGEHHDTFTPEGKPRPHLHLIVNRIPKNDHKAVNSSWIKRRIEKALQQLRTEFGLTPVTPSWEVERSAPSTGQIRRYRQEEADFREGKRAEAPQLPIKVQLQDAIDQACQNQPNFTELVKNLAQQDITTTTTEKGISYGYQGVYFQASKLGKAYTWQGLQQYRGVKVDTAFIEDETPSNTTRLTENPWLRLRESRVQGAREKLENSSPCFSLPTPLLISDASSISSQPTSTTMENPNWQQQQWAMEILPILQKLLNHYQKDELDNGYYEIHRFNGAIVVDSKDNLDFPLLGISNLENQPQIWANRLQERDFNHFQTIKEELEQLSHTQPQNLFEASIQPSEAELQQWSKVRNNLYTQQGIPPAFTQALLEEGKLQSNEEGEAIFVNKPLITRNTQNSAFYLATSGIIERAVITDEPLQAIASFLVEDSQNQTIPTLYLSINHTEQLPLKLLRELDEVDLSINEPTLAETIKQEIPQAKASQTENWLEKWQKQSSFNQEIPPQSKPSRMRQQQLSL